MSSERISSPYATGGGGIKLEHEIGALYLAALLAEDIPLGIGAGKILKIQFQALHTGILVDDLVITTVDGNKRRVIAYQIKHSLTFSESDSEFKSVVEDCWATFVGNTRFRFNPETDLIGIGIGVYQQKFEHLQTLLEWARTSLTSQEFLNKAYMQKFSSKEKRQIIETIRKTIDNAKGSKLADNESWKFLRCFIVNHFDMRENGRDRIYCINNLRRLVEDDPRSKALFDTLYSIVGRYVATGGSIDRNSLMKELSNQIVNMKSVKEREYSLRTQEILNHNVLKVLKTLDVNRDSLYSIGLKVEDGRLVNNLPYIKHAQKFLIKYDHINTPRV